MSKYLVITRDYLLPVTLILSLVVGWWICFHTSAFTVREIICELDYEPCDNPFVMAELDKYAGINLLTLDTNSLKDKLLSGDYTVRQAEITRALPARLTVSMQSVYPVAAISHLGVEGEWVTVDSRFRIIGLRREDPNVPTVQVENISELQPGAEVMSASVRQAIELALVIKAEQLAVKNIRLEATTLTIILQSGTQALLTTTKDLTGQLRALQAILLDPTMSNVNTVDVRFNQPVLKSY